MKKVVVLALIILFMAAPAQAFVSKLHPFGGPIPCMRFWAFLHIMTSRQVIVDRGWTVAQMSAKLRSHYNTVWSAEDSADNTALIDQITAQNAVGKILISLSVISACILSEGEQADVNTKNKFRTLIGIPTQ